MESATSPDTSIPASNQVAAVSAPESDARTIENVSLIVVLDHLATRIAGLEAQLSKRADASGGGMGVEVLKVLSAWPTFGLLFLVLFYVPLRDAIGAIPDKVKQAEQIELLGVSLKSTLRVEAQRIGAVGLSETLPALSPKAVELLLRAVPDREESLLSYSMNDRLIERVWLPSSQMLDVLGEIEQKGLVTLIVRKQQSESTGTQAVRDAIAALRKERPGRERSGTDSSRIEWELDRPQSFQTPYFGWGLTDLGKKGVDVILSAVSSQLTASAASEKK